MARVFFNYYLRDGASGEAFEDAILSGVKPVATAAEGVLGWSLHRTVDWPGSSAEKPDYVSVVDVSDLDLWADDAADSIVSTHGALSPFLVRIAMTVADGSIG
jgi:hypothetical protein